jgi:hypothetical protein
LGAERARESRSAGPVAGNSFTARARAVSRETEPELHRAVADLSRDKYGWGDGLVVELVPEINAQTA